VSNLRDQIRSASDMESEAVEVPEWGVTVEIRTMTGRQRARIMTEMAHGGIENVDVEHLWSSVLTTCIYDPESGENVFTDDDLEWLMTEKSAAVIDRLSRRCLDVSGITEDGADEVGKGSSGSPTG